MTSAIWPLNVALEKVLSADADLVSYMGRKIEPTSQSQFSPIFSMKAPDWVKGDYIILGESLETNRGMLNRAGKANEETLHIWSPVSGKQRIAVIYDHLDRILNNTKLEVEGFTMMLGQLEMVISLVDAGGDYMHAIARYTTLNQVSA